MAIALGLFLPLVWLLLTVVKLFFWIPIQNFEQLFHWPLLWLILGAGLFSWLLSGDRPR
ncbi:hypothetical protein VZG28_04565 [Synechococcus elongatus IITB4]|uniref:hypothetical protein n=1 Tax=Synechococcus elongatus TaxID=32046 RepID=UPI0030D1DE42